MKHPEEDPKKKANPDFPDIKKIEKGIQTENKKKLPEVPDNIPDEQSSPHAPEEVPPLNNDEEV